jgi:hypothetical protein
MRNSIHQLKTRMGRLLLPPKQTDDPVDVDG